MLRLSELLFSKSDDAGGVRVCHERVDKKTAKRAARRALKRGERAPSESAPPSPRVFATPPPPAGVATAMQTHGVPRSAVWGAHLIVAHGVILADNVVHPPAIERLHPVPPDELTGLLQRQVRREPSAVQQLACGFATALNARNELVEVHMQWPLVEDLPRSGQCANPATAPWRSFTVGELGLLFSGSATLFVKSNSYPQACSCFSLRFRNRENEARTLQPLAHSVSLTHYSLTFAGAQSRV